jgi:hypothetical protein
MEAMPEFEIVSVKEAMLRTATPRQGHYFQEYASYIHQLPQRQAGKLHLLDDENPNTIRRRLVLAGQAVGIPLVIKRSGQDLYFWAEPAAVEKPERRRGRRSRRQPEPAPPEQRPPFPEQPLEEPQAFPEEVRLPEE